MSGLVTLLSLSVLMAVASFLAGILPISFSPSRSQLRLISTIGMGILVGTSLIIIIPEGVEAIYTSSDSHQENIRRTEPGGLSTTNRLHVPFAMPSTPAASHTHMLRELPDAQDFELPGPVIPDFFGEPPKTPTEPGRVGILDSESESAGEPEEEIGSHGDEAHHAWIGIALISGFTLMFLIDRLPQIASSPQPQVKTHNIALNHIGRRFNILGNHDQAEEEEEGEGFLNDTTTSQPTKRGSATTIGLVIHAAADGIALGASSTTSQTRLSLVIFFAIMIHKAPAAFGLTSILLRQGLSKRMVRTHLILFSLAAPAGALLTWMAAQILGSRGASQQVANSTWWTGVLLLFSAGTFLYVAMHSMQDVLDGHHDRPEMNGHANGSLERRDSFEQQPDSKPSLKDIAATVFGMILPLFLQIGHAH